MTFIVLDKPGGDAIDAHIATGHGDLRHCGLGERDQHAPAALDDEIENVATAEILQGEWLRTGDAGYLDDDGYLFIRDRVKDMIVSGGENIYPVEVENALQSHPEVADSAVIGIPDAAWGERVIAFVVPSATACADTASLLDHCRRLVAGYKCPREIHFVESIPRNAAGKILRRELREPFWRGNDRKVG